MSNLKAVRSDIHYKMVNHQPVDLTVTFEGTGSGSAVLLGKQIIVTLTAAESAKYVNISTPIGFRVINAHSIRTNGAAAVWALGNTGDAITDTVTMTADTDIDVPTTIDDDYNTFARGDDDLRIDITTQNCTGLIFIDIEPTIA